MGDKLDCFPYAGSSYSYSVDDAGRIDCLEEGGIVSVTPEGSQGICFIKDVLTRALGEQILELGGTYGVACYIRDSVLSPSAKGRRLLKHYYAGVPMTLFLVGNDPNLLLEAIKTWRALSLLAFEIMRMDSGQADGKRAHRIKYTLRLHTQMRNFLAHLSSATQDRKYIQGLREIETELAEHVGKNVPEILEKMKSYAKRGGRRVRSRPKA